MIVPHDPPDQTNIAGIEHDSAVQLELTFRTDIQLAEAACIVFSRDNRVERMNTLDDNNKVIIDFQVNHLVAAAAGIEIKNRRLRVIGFQQIFKKPFKQSMVQRVDALKICAPSSRKGRSSRLKKKLSRET